MARLLPLGRLRHRGNRLTVPDGSGFSWTSRSRDPEGQAGVAAFRKGLQDHGWVEGRNVRFDSRWTGGDPARMRRLAAEVVGLTPEVIMNGGLPTLQDGRQP